MVEGESDDIDVSGTFSIAEYSPLDSVCSAQDSKFCSRDSTACLYETR
jgi:hypothetical protein